MKPFLFTVSFFFCLLTVFSNKQLPFSEFKFGDNKEKFNSYLIDISNSNSWEETKFIYSGTSTIFGLNPSKIELTFWNNRLCNLSIELPINELKQVESQLNTIYGKSTTVTYDSNNVELNWKSSDHIVFITNYPKTILLNFQDEKQKDFHFTDLFHGILFYLIVVIVGLFVVYWFIVWMINSYCKNCKTFNMKYQEILLENPTDYSHMDGVQVFFERPEMHYDKVYKFKCNKCGNIRNDRYGSWWSWRNKHK